jgi:hypothetical protein
MKMFNNKVKRTYQSKLIFNFMAKFPQTPLNLIFKYLLHFAQNIEIKR